MSTQLWILWKHTSGGDDSLRWCLREQRKHAVQMQPLHSGTVEQLAEFISNQRQRPVLHTVLLLDGDELVTRFLPYQVSERKHLANLLPFALETTLAVDLAKVQVAIGDVSGMSADGKPVAVVAYTDLQTLQMRINTLEQLGLEVEAVYGLPALLPATTARWALEVEADICHLNAPGLLCISAEPDLLAHCIDQALTAPGSVAPAAVQVQGSHQVPAVIADLLRAAGIELALTLAAHDHAWAHLQTTGSACANLRQGALAAPLRLGKYWQVARLPVLAATLAFAASLLVTVTETVLDRQRVQQLEARIEQRYREVVPEGVLVDAAQQLRTQIARLNASAIGPGVVAMLDDMASVFAAHQSVRMHSLSYSHNRAGGAPELQMSISAPATADILALGEQLTAAGWSAQAQNISRSGDFQQASLLIRGKVL